MRYHCYVLDLLVQRQNPGVHIWTPLHAYGIMQHGPRINLPLPIYPIRVMYGNRGCVRRGGWEFWGPLACPARICQAGGSALGQEGEGSRGGRVAL